ncbi:MAG: aminotransferase class IV [Bacteroidales bacterium]
MSRLVIETIQLNNGSIQLADYHQHRMNKTVFDVWGIVNQFSIAHISVPDYARRGLWKCRVLYGPQVIDITFSSYTYKHISSLQCVYNDDISYPYKFADRQVFVGLLSKKSHADEIIIIKHGSVTDTSFSNLVLYDGTHWYTPSTYLLPGTMRQYLLDTNCIHEIQIGVSDMWSFEKVRLLNAFHDLAHGNDIFSDKIYK